MKIYSSIIIDMDSMMVIEEVSEEYDGPIAYCGAGSISWPSHLRKMQSRMISKAMFGGAVSEEAGLLAHLGHDPTDEDFVFGDLGIARELNPFWVETEAGSGVFEINTPFDPIPMLEDVVSRYDEYNATVRGLDVETSWAANIDLAEGKAEEILSDADIQAAETAFDTRQQLPLLRSMNRFSGGMADINAVNSSAFIIGFSLMNLQHKQEVANFGNDLALNSYNNRISLIFGEAANLANAQKFRIDSHRVAAHLLSEINRVRIVASREFDNTAKQWETLAVRWNLELWQYYANAIASIDGAAATPGRGERIESDQSSLGGAITGSIAGAQIGASVSPTFKGVGIGGALGAAAGFFAARD